MSTELPDFTTAPARMDTADEWVRRIDSGKLAEMLKPYFNGGDVAYGEHIECAEAVLAALPALVELGFDPEEEIARKMATNKTRGPRG